MGLAGWIVIPEWEKWQARRDRHDPWIKDYVDQLDRDEYVSLTFADRGLLGDIRRLFSRLDGHLKVSSLPGLTQQKVRQKSLDSLRGAGFIEILAAKPPPLGRQFAANPRPIRGLEVEVEVEGPPYPLEDEGEKPSRLNGLNPRARGVNPRALAADAAAELRARAWIANGLAAHVPDDHLEEVLEDEFGPLEPELLAELATEARRAAR